MKVAAYLVLDAGGAPVVAVLTMARAQRLAADHGGTVEALGRWSEIGDALLAAREEAQAAVERVRGELEALRAEVRQGL